MPGTPAGLYTGPGWQAGTPAESGQYPGHQDRPWRSGDLPWPRPAGGLPLARPEASGHLDPSLCVFAGADPDRPARQLRHQG